MLITEFKFFFFFFVGCLLFILALASLAFWFCLLNGIPKDFPYFTFIRLYECIYYIVQVVRWQFIQLSVVRGCCKSVSDNYNV